MSTLRRHVFRSSIFSLVFMGLVFIGSVVLYGPTFWIAGDLLELEPNKDFAMMILFYALPFYMAGVVFYLGQLKRPGAWNYLFLVIVLMIIVAMEYLLTCLHIRMDALGRAIFAYMLMIVLAVSGISALLAARFLKARLSVFIADGSLFPDSGWRWLFYLFGVIGLIWVLLFIPSFVIFALDIPIF